MDTTIAQLPRMGLAEEELVHRDMEQGPAPNLKKEKRVSKVICSVKERINKKPIG